MTSRINLLCSLAYHIYTPSYIEYHRYGNMFIRLFSTVQYVNCSQISAISVQQHRVSLHHVTSREHAPQQHISTSHVAHHYQAICTVQWHHSSNQHVARMEFPHYLARTTYKLHTLSLYVHQWSTASGTGQWARVMPSIALLTILSSAFLVAQMVC